MAVKRRKKRKAAEGSLKEIRLFNELCRVVNEQGVETRIEAGRFRGGFCTVEGDKHILFINKKHPFDQRIALLISEIQRLGNEDKHISLPEALLLEIDAM